MVVNVVRFFWYLVDDFRIVRVGGFLGYGFGNCLLVFVRCYE